MKSISFTFFFMHCEMFFSIVRCLSSHIFVDKDSTHRGCHIISNGSYWHCT